VKRLREILERNLAGPEAKLPAQRRNAVELAVVMIEHHGPIFRDLFVASGFCSLLRRLSETVSDMEDYATFSGTAGVTSHSVSMSALVDQAHHAVAMRGSRRFHIWAGAALTPKFAPEILLVRTNKPSMLFC
jgi:hypothetical protein